MNLRREGWAKAVGSVFLTRDGHEVRLTHYSVTLIDSACEQELLGELIPEPTVEVGVSPDMALILKEAAARMTYPIEFDEQGCYLSGTCSAPGGEQVVVYAGDKAVRQPHALDLVGAKSH